MQQLRANGPWSNRGHYSTDRIVRGGGVRGADDHGGDEGDGVVVVTHRLIPRKPPWWLEKASYEFANACRVNTPGTVSINIGSGSIDVVNLNGTVYMCQDGEWFVGVKVND